MISRRWSWAALFPFPFYFSKLAEAHYDEKPPTHFCRCRRGSPGRL